MSELGGESTDFRNELAGMSAPPVRTKAEATYRRGELLEERPPLMACLGDLFSRRDHLIPDQT